MRSSSMVPFILFLLTLLFVIGLAPSEADGADRVIDGPWDLTDPLTAISGESIVVRGNVTIHDGAVLKLTDCQLVLNSMDGHLLYFRVEEGGRLVAIDTNVSGGSERIKMAFHNESELLGCHITKLHGLGEGYGIWIARGNVSMTDCTVEDVNGYVFQVDTGLMATNVTTRNVRFGHYNIQYQNYTGPVKLILEDCHLDGSNEFPGGIWGEGFRVMSDINEVDPVVVSIRNSTMTNMRVCSRTQLLSDHSVEFLGCIISNVREGFLMQLERGRFKIKDTEVIGISYTDSDGLRAMIMDDADIELSKLTMRGFEDAMTLGLLLGSQAKDVRWDDLLIWQCDNGISVGGAGAGSPLRLNLHNCSVQAARSELNYIALGWCYINLYDNEHIPLQGQALDSSAEVRAIWILDVKEAIWVGDGRIPNGTVQLEDDDSQQVATLDLKAPSRMDIVGWYVKQTELKYRAYLIPSITVDGHTFVGNDYDFWNDSTGRIEFVDDQTPDIHISSPTDGSMLNVSVITFNGAYHELGSGVASTEYSLDSGEWTAFPTRPDGTWFLTLLNIDEGDHELKVRITDRTNHSMEAPPLSFSVDTLVPMLELDDIPSVVNTTYVTISGMTEPGVQVRVNDVPIPVLSDGRFSHDFEILEGTFYFRIVATDPFHNANTTAFTVVRDTLPPTLTVVEPVSGKWTNESQVTIRGIVGSDADLFIDGKAAEAPEGLIEHTLGLEEGEVTITILARDSAGNVARIDLVVHVDLTAPMLTLMEPIGTEVITMETSVAISGEVDDDTLETVVINGDDYMIVDGFFAKVFPLQEGINVFDISVTDLAGNTDAISVMVVRDTTAPNGDTVVSPIDGELIEVDGNTFSTGQVIRVVITMDEPVVITLAGGQASEPNAVHEFEHTLIEGSNTIPIRIIDEAGNEAPAIRLVIYYDTTPPSLLVSEPPDGATTRERTVTVRGTAGNGAVSVRVGGQEVTLGAGGGFETTITLDKGGNLIELEALDAMSNKASMNLTLTYEPRAPETDGEGVPVVVVSACLGIIAIVIVAVLIQRGRGKGPSA